jgi:hypothetical protein
VKNPGKVADAFNDFFLLTITEDLNTHQAGKEDAVTVL